MKKNLTQQEALLVKALKDAKGQYIPTDDLVVAIGTQSSGKIGRQRVHGLVRDVRLKFGEHVIETRPMTDWNWKTRDTGYRLGVDL